MIYPMAMMVLLTFIVACNALRVRIHSVRSGEMSASYYTVMKGRATEEVLKATGALNNLFEVPVLFYAGGILCIVMQVENSFSLVMAWGFVISRIAHAWIYTTYNTVIHRVVAFLAAFLFVILLWCGLLWQVM